MATSQTLLRHRYTNYTITLNEALPPKETFTQDIGQGDGQWLKVFRKLALIGKLVVAELDCVKHLDAFKANSSLLTLSLNSMLLSNLIGVLLRRSLKVCTEALNLPTPIASLKNPMWHYPACIKKHSQYILNTFSVLSQYFLGTTQYFFTTFSVHS